MSASSPMAGTINDEDLVYRILTVIAERERCDLLELPPLAETLDTDALVALVEGPGVTEVSFSYYGYLVSIDCDGELQVMEA